MKKSILQRMVDAEHRGDTGSNSELVEKSLPTRRHSSPVISNVGRALVQLSEDSVVSLDPNRLERSPFRDRFDDDEEALAELDTLKASIAAEGQKIPVLVRPHPSKTDCYQIVYGHRRWAAIRALIAESERPETIKIKAYIRELTDRQLIEEQSLENGVRENLTWIEQAMWAVQLKGAGLSQRAICPILGLSEAGVSHLFRVTDLIPEDIVFAIGRSKGIGRPKWTAFAELLRDLDKVELVRRLVRTDEFREAVSSDRFALAMRATTSPPDNGRDKIQEMVREFSVGNRVFGRMKQTSAGMTMTILNQEDDFAGWLAERMQSLLLEYLKHGPVA